MKASTEWLVLCERLIHDSLSDNITLVSCLHTVEAAEFPSQLPGFAFAARLSTDAPPSSAMAFTCRLVRLSPAEEPETVCELPFEWAAGARTAQVGSNFHVLRLKRAELLGFRLDHRANKGRWVLGPTVTVEVRRLHAAGVD